MRYRVRGGARLLLAVLGAALASCSQSRVSSVSRQDLFSLELGPLDNQVNLSDAANSFSRHRTSLAMRDGLFYLSDTNGKKIIRYTSFGDPIFVIYNEAANPPLMTLRHGIEEEGQATRWSIAYSLREPGAITVDSRKHIYVADRADDESRALDTENKTLLDTAVLHFDERGRFVNALGQGGVGGKPFPHVSGIYATVDDEIAVVCLLPGGWNVYWFGADGSLLYLVHLLKDGIPLPPDVARRVSGEAAFASMDSVVAAPDNRRLFLKVDYYSGEASPAPEPNWKSPPVPEASFIWSVNIENGIYEDYIEVPFFDYTVTENNQKINQRMLYSLMGAARQGRMFLYFPVERGYSLLVLSFASEERRRGFIEVRGDELEYNTFNLSPEGILSGLLATNWEARLVWWRTDHLLGNMGL